MVVLHLYGLTKKYQNILCKNDFRNTNQHFTIAFFLWELHIDSYTFIIKIQNFDKVYILTLSIYFENWATVNYKNKHL